MALPHSFSSVDDPSQLHPSLTLERLNLLDHCVADGCDIVETLKRSQAKFFMDWPEKSRAIVRYEMIVQAARNLFKGQPGVSVNTKQNRYILVFDNRCGVHFKKLNKRGVGRVPPSLNRRGLPMFPGMDAELEIIFYIAGYQLDPGGLYVQKRLLNHQDDSVIVRQWSLESFALEARLAYLPSQEDVGEDETIIRPKKRGGDADENAEEA